VAPDAAASVAASGSIRDGEHLYQVVIPRGWSPIAAPPGTLLAYQAAGGAARLAVTRVEAGRPPNPRHHERAADEIERGVERATRGYRRVKRRLSEVREVPVLDLWYEREAPRRAGTETVMTRFLLFRRHTVLLSIGFDRPADRALRRAAEAALRSFIPFVPA
jgi:hypothetical protein